MGLPFLFPLMRRQACPVGVDFIDPTEFLATDVLELLSIAVQGPLAAQEQSEDGQGTLDHKHLAASLILRLARRRTTHLCQWQVFRRVQ